MFQPLITRREGQDVTLACVHWKHWPPLEAYTSIPIEELRRDGRLSESQYAQYQTWKRVCGLIKMEKNKCPGCPHARLAEVRNHLPCLVTLDGTLVTPLTDREGDRLARGHLVTNIRSSTAK
jgi:molybdenum cofactor biosynthesis enzyme MoaA